MRKTFLAYENESDTLNITESFRATQQQHKIYANISIPT